MSGNASEDKPKGASSAMWDFFKLSMVDKNWVQCRLCDSKVSRKSRTTSNMRTHLKNNHQQVFAQIQTSLTQTTTSRAASSCSSTPEEVIISTDDEETEDGCTATSSCSSSGGGGGKKKKKAASSTTTVVGPLDLMYRKHQPIVKGSSKWGQITNKICNLLVKAMLPIHLVEHDYFVELINFLEPGYTVPSRKYFTDVAIPSRYADATTAVKAVLTDKKGSTFFFSVTSDAWTSAVNMNPYLSLTCHFIDESWNLVAKNLETSFTPEDHTGMYVDDTSGWRIVKNNEADCN